MRAGQLRNLVTIQTLTETNNQGAVSQGWADDSTAWASIVAMNGDERNLYQAVQGETLYKITLRYIDLSSTQNRIAFDGKVFHLKNVVSDDRKTTTICDAVTREGESV